VQDCQMPFRLSFLYPLTALHLQPLDSSLQVVGTQRVDVRRHMAENDTG
jgi:hypothetical protein